MSVTYDYRRELTQKAMEQLLHAAHDRRARLELIDLPEDEAQLRIRALDVLDSRQLLALAELPEQQRAGQIRALVAAQRRRHHPLDVAVAGIDDGTGQALFRWTCPCGRGATRDYFTAKEAREVAGRHMVGGADPEEKLCNGCGNPMPAGQGRYCSRECRQMNADGLLMESE